MRTEVHAVCAQAGVAEQRRFCDGFTEAAGSVCRNISEGFGRFGSGFIVQYFTYALASLAEVEDYVHECRTRRFIDEPRFTRTTELIQHTRATTLKFMRFHQGKLRRSSRSARST